VQASCHYATDPTETVKQVDETDTAWATPSVNADGFQIEQAGYAEFGLVGWASWTDVGPIGMLNTQTVPLLVDLCRRWGIPPVLLEPADLLAGKAGITDHERCSRAYGGDHWDCGKSFPIAYVIEQVAHIISGQPAMIESKDDAEMVRLIRNRKDGSLWWWNGQTRAPVPTNADDDWQGIETRLKNLVALHPSCAQWPAANGNPPSLFIELEDWDIRSIPIVGG
jgi:hypothetical protein